MDGGKIRALSIVQENMDGQQNRLMGLRDRAEVIIVMGQSTSHTV